MYDGPVLQGRSPPAALELALIFDTAAAPERERYGRWCEHVGKVLASFDFNPDTDEPFHGRFETLDLGPVRVNRGDCSTGHWTRRREHLNDDHVDFGLYLSGTGSFRLIQNGIDCVLGPHHFALIDDSKPSDLYGEASGTEYGFAVSRAALEKTSIGKCLPALPIIGAQSASMRMLWSYLDSVFAAKADLSDPALAEKIGNHLFDLIVLGLGPARDVAHQAQNRGLKAARVQAILTAIEQNFATPDISSKAIAAQLNISQRYLHELLEERGLTFTQLVLEKRLGKAHGMLCDPRYDHLRIGQIAYESGFNDLSHFNHRFRARFGEAPGSVRQTSA
jgi:AraC-like DNA-binding protein